MPHYMMYVCLQDDDKIATFTMDAATGRLTPQATVPVAGGPSLLAISPDRQMLYVGQRVTPAISSFRIDHASGGLTPQGTITPPYPPAYLATDRTGKHLLAAYYQGGHVAVHPIGVNGVVGAPPIEWLPTATGAHAIQTDPSNRFAFVPHIARFNDNVLEPLRESYGPNMILQFAFDASSGHLTPNASPRIEPTDRLGPRHYCFHPTLNLAYFSNEQGCSVTAYRLDLSTGTLTAVQTISTLPAGVSVRNTCSQIQITASGKFLYVPNRGHNSIAAFSVDASSGHLTPSGHVATEAVPSAFSLDPTGHFVFAAGSATGRLAAYRMNGDTGVLTPLETYAVGQRPMWVLITPLGD